RRTWWWRATCTRAACRATSRSRWSRCRGNWMRCTSWCCARIFPKGAPSPRCSLQGSGCGMAGSDTGNDELGRLREGIISLAREAAAAILEVYEGVFAVQHKDDSSPLTAFDLASLRRIVAGLQRLSPDIPVLSEESAEGVATATRRQWPRLWV